MRPVLRVAAKELKDILRERSIAVALLVQFFIAAFSAFLAVGLLALYDPGSARADISADVAYTGPGGFDAHLDDARRWRIHHVAPEAALDGFHQGAYDAVVQEEWQEANGTRSVTLLLPDGQLTTTLLVTQLKGLLQEYELELRQERQDRLAHQVLTVELPRSAQAAVPYPFIFATLLPLLLLTPVFLSGAIAADSLTGELQSRTLTLLRSAPAALPALLAGKLLVPLLLAPLQFLLWAGLLALNGIHAANLPLLCLVSLLFTMVLAGTGFALAARLRRDGPTQASYALAAITQAVLSLLMPRDPLNLVAIVATGRVDGEAWASIAILAVAAAAALGLGFWDAARGIRARPD
jgi:ABC-2 type transport system permease protein